MNNFLSNLETISTKKKSAWVVAWVVVAVRNRAGEQPAIRRRGKIFPLALREDRADLPNDFLFFGERERISPEKEIIMLYT